MRQYRRDTTLGGQGIKEMSTTDLGTREVNGVTCDGPLHEIVDSRRGLTIRFELEEWLTNAFGFPLRVKRVFRMLGRGGESTTDLRNIVLLKDYSFEEYFRPNKDWREVDGEVQRLNTGRMGFFFPKKQSTGRPLESGVDRTEDHHPGIPSRTYVSARPERLLHAVANNAGTASRMFASLSE